jgi:hypothetical protein
MRIGGDTWGLWLNELVGNGDCPIMLRHRAIVAGYTVRLQRWYPGHQDVHVHNHPWWFLSIVLRGGYVDDSRCRSCDNSGLMSGDDAYMMGMVEECTACDGRGGGLDLLRAPTIRFRRPEHAHSVIVSQKGCLNVLITGREELGWGYWVGRRFMDWAAFAFAGHDTAACHDGESRVSRDSL